MKDPKDRKLFEQILEKTKVGRIIWEPTANDSEFLTVLPGGLALKISKTYEDDSYGNPDEQGALVLNGEDGELLRMTPDGDVITWSEFSELYEFARRKALRVEAKVDKLLGDLARL
jgi:hypothetical protein